MSTDIIINANLKLTPNGLIRYGKALKKSGLEPQDFIMLAVVNLIFETLGDEGYEV